MNDQTGQPERPKRKRRRIAPQSASHQAILTSSDTEKEDIHPAAEGREDESSGRQDIDVNLASDSDEDALIHESNAYPGATNTIGSIHQRKWFVALDRRNSGFRKSWSKGDRGRWRGSWEPFFVYGRDHERSVVTGRNADNIMEDGHVEKFVGRKQWRAILE